MPTRFAEHLIAGAHASRPAAGAVPQGTLYACTTHGLLYQSDTAAWTTYHDPAVAGVGAHTHAGEDIASGTVADARVAGTIARDSEVAAHEADSTGVHGIADTAALYVAGGTDVAVADGGTGASTPAGARTNLELSTGTGSPEGAVTASVGAYYVQTDAAAGSAFWYKKSGAGNTGWEQVTGGVGGSGDPTGQLGAGFDGGLSTLATPKYQDVVVPYAGTITGWRVKAQQTGSLAFGVAKATVAPYESFSSIVGAEAPGVTSGTYDAGTDMTGWTTAVAAGDVLRFTLSSATSGVRQALVVLDYDRV